MKFITLYLLFISLSFAETNFCPQTKLGVEEFIEMNTKVIFPEMTDLNLHYLYKNYKMDSTKCPQDQVWVQGPKFVEDGYDNFGNKVDNGNKDLQQKLGFSFCVPKSKFKKEKEQALSIFQTRVATGSKNEGTSFLVGDNIVMTNYHIAVPLDSNPSDCRALEVTLNNEPKEWIKCKKILYCDKVKDVCFVEMQPPKLGKNLSDLVPKVTLNCAPVKNGPASVIGNSNCFGLQAGEGKMKDQIINKSSPINGMFEHHVPTTGGASGSPVFNAAGEVVGINHSHTSKESYVSMNEEKSANRGTSMNYIINSIREKISFAPPQVAPFSDNNLMNKFRKEDPSDLKKILKEITSNSKNCR